MSEKRVLLIIGGGVAAYKSLLLIRLLAKVGIKTTCIVTKAGEEFITPLSVGALSGERVFTDLFSLSDEAEMGHIELSRSADLIVVVPATADLMAKSANGFANDLASTTLLATDKRVLYVPSMNVRMWEHPATQKNLQTLKQRGALFVGPVEGDMACGEFGFGRMSEPETIADTVINTLAGDTHIDALKPQSLKGKHILITAGPTREPIDPVRYLSNNSSGKQGYALAQACIDLGANVSLVSGPVALTPPKGAHFIAVQTARDMLGACEAALPVDVFIAVAAVADWRPKTTGSKKIKKSKQAIPPLTLVENPDILKTIAHHKKRPPLVIGFAAETHNILPYAQAKLKRKNCDWMIANDVSGDVMGGDENTMILVTKDKIEHWTTQTKQNAAKQLATAIAKHIGT
ncbi:MAG: bifunctional phosphopantothenoylcysteine decarboxylase/phosphopantothenate--cysteine ligase CoaBC [Robiginitomaculum sp.]|nr:bifunctional phosphopantothenoylcysteine decarboxylase/phosphopantothenate--cysteine ligase CoaBC [Robiginitomaculum sp.]